MVIYSHGIVNISSTRASYVFLSLKKYQLHVLKLHVMHIEIFFLTKSYFFGSGPLIKQMAPSQLTTSYTRMVTRKKLPALNKFYVAIT